MCWYWSIIIKSPWWPFHLAYGYGVKSHASSNFVQWGVKIWTNLYGKTDNSNVSVLVYHQRESTVTSLSDLWLWGQRSKSSIMGSYLEINHYMISIYYKCKLHRPNWVNIDVTWMKWCLDEDTLGVFMKLGSKVI